MSEKIFKIILDDKNKIKMKLDCNSKLSELRILLKNKIKQNFFFVDYEDFPLDKEIEKDLTIKDLNTDSTINLKEEIKLNTIPKNEPLEEAKLIKKGKVNIYQYPTIKFTQLEESKAFIILIVGQTGSGKTLFINSFINYLMDIEPSDNFRYSLINEKDRETKCLNIYNIRSKKLIVKLVDTQGFGGEGGIFEDDKITIAIKNAFMNELNSINTILFAVKSSEHRLTNYQKYIFSSIISLFGKDIKKNFLALITFYNGSGIPSAVTTLEQSDFKDIIPSIEKPWYLCFDSNIIFDESKDEFIEICYSKAKKNYKLLCDKINTSDRKSLQQSKDNLDLMEKIKILGELLTDQMDKLGEIEEQKKILEKNEPDSQEIHYFPKKSNDIELEVLPKEQRDFKENDYYIIVNSIIKNNETIKGINQDNNILKALIEEEKELKKIIIKFQEKIKAKYEELKMISINNNYYHNVIEFLKKLIEEEATTRKEGYEKRIKFYEKRIAQNQNILKYI